MNHCALNGGDLACTFPRQVMNNTQTVTFRLDTVDLLNKTIDVSIYNPQAKVLGFEFDVSGINITQVEDLTPAEYNVQINSQGQKIIGLSLVDSTLDKNNNYQKLCKIHFNNATIDSVCISEVIDVVNQYYESTLKGISGNCLDISTLTSTQSIGQTGPFVLYPNPVNNVLQISSQSDEILPFEYSLTDVTGKVLINAKAKTGKLTELNTQELSEGNYVLKIISETKEFNYKVTVSH